MTDLHRYFRWLRWELQEQEAREAGLAREDALTSAVAVILSLLGVGLIGVTAWLVSMGWFYQIN